MKRPPPKPPLFPSPTLFRSPERPSRAGAERVICNADPPPNDALAAPVLREPLNEVLPTLAAVPHTESVDSGG